jgi:hypothetical protein
VAGVTIRPAYSVWPECNRRLCDIHTRGAVIQRVFSHDVNHAAELNETLGVAGLRQIDLWN